MAQVITPEAHLDTADIQVTKHKLSSYKVNRQSDFTEEKERTIIQLQRTFITQLDLDLNMLKGLLSKLPELIAQSI